MVLTKLQSPFFEFGIFRLFWALKRPKKGIFAYFLRMRGQKKAKNAKIEKRKSYFFKKHCKELVCQFLGQINNFPGGVAILVEKRFF